MNDQTEAKEEVNEKKNYGKPLDIMSFRNDPHPRDDSVHKIWTDANSLRILEATLAKMGTDRKDEWGTLKFDKDDTDAVAFVTAASNLRAACFGIERQS